jgi:hypothetical protein
VESHETCTTCNNNLFMVALSPHPLSSAPPRTLLLPYFPVSPHLQPSYLAQRLLTDLTLSVRLLLLIQVRAVLLFEGLRSQILHPAVLFYTSEHLCVSICARYVLHVLCSFLISAFFFAHSLSVHKYMSPRQYLAARDSHLA